MLAWVKWVTNELKLMFNEQDALSVQPDVQQCVFIMTPCLHVLHEDILLDST